MDFWPDISSVWARRRTEPSGSRTNPALDVSVLCLKHPANKCPRVGSSHVSSTCWRTSRSQSHITTLGPPATLSPSARMTLRTMGMKPPQLTINWRLFLVPATAQAGSCKLKSEDQAFIPWYLSLKNALQPMHALHFGLRTSARVQRNCTLRREKRSGCTHLYYDNEADLEYSHPKSQVGHRKRARRGSFLKVRRS